MNDDIEIRPHTDDERVDALAIELVGLRPQWHEANADYKRSCAILKELDQMALGKWQKKQLMSFVQFHWTAAAAKALELGLTSRAYTNSSSQLLSGICLVQATQTPAQMRELV